MTRRKTGHKPEDQDESAEEESGSTPAVCAGGRKSPRPDQCRTYTRGVVAESIPDIVDTFVSEAKRGSVSHFNLLTKFGGFDHRPVPDPPPRRRKSFARRLLDDMKEHQAKLVAAHEARTDALPGNSK